MYRFKISYLLLWSLCGFVWWTIGAFVVVLIPTRIWIDGTISSIAGFLIGGYLYINNRNNFKIHKPININTASRKEISEVFSSSNFKYKENIGTIISIWGFILGMILGFMSAKGNTIFSISYEVPPSIIWRIGNGIAGGIVGIFSNFFTYYTLSKLSSKPWNLFFLLLFILFFIFIIFPLIIYP